MREDVAVRRRWKQRSARQHNEYLEAKRRVSGKSSEAPKPDASGPDASPVRLYDVGVQLSAHRVCGHVVSWTKLVNM